MYHSKDFKGEHRLKILRDFLAKTKLDECRKVEEQKVFKKEKEIKLTNRLIME